MKALLYKTFTVNAGSTLPSYLIVILFCCPLPFPWLDQISTYYLIMATLPSVFLFHRERKDKWYQLAPTLPISPWRIVGEKYLLAMLFVIPIPFLMEVALRLNYVGIPAPTAAVAFRSIALMLVFSACFLFLTFWLGPARISWFYLPLLLLFFLFDAGCWFIAGSLLIHLPISVPLSLAIALLFFLLSYRAAVGRYVHRTW